MDALEIIRRHGPALSRIAYLYASSRSDREDVHQEIAVALVKALPRFRGDSSERTYVLRIAHNVGITFMASARRRRATWKRRNRPRGPWIPKRRRATASVVTACCMPYGRCPSDCDR